MKTVHEAVRDILDAKQKTLTESSFISERRDYQQLIKMADDMGIITPTQHLFDAFLADDHGSCSRRQKHTMVLKRLDAETGLHAVRPDMRPYNRLPLPSVAETAACLENTVFPIGSNVSIGCLIIRAEQELQKQGHKEGSIDDDYMDSMHTIHCFFINNGHDNYSGECMERFLVQNDSLLSDGRIYKNLWYNNRKAAFILMEIADTGHYSWKRISASQKILSDKGLESIRQRYLMNLRSNNLSDETIRNLDGAFHDIIKYTGIRTCDDLLKLSPKDVQELISGVSKKHDHGSLHTVYGRIRLVLRYLYEEGATRTKLDTCVMVAATFRNNVAGYFSKEGECRLYGYLDNLSLRDKAICLLGLDLGLRDSDICHLRFDQIDWEADRIRIIQHKNGAPLVLPLTADIGNALMDYIFKERPKTEHPVPYIFLTSVAPYRRLQHAYYPCRNLIENSGAVPIQGKHKGSHLFRDNLVHRLLEKKISHQVITDSLGHRSKESDKYYISMESDMLRQCAIGLGLIGKHCWEEGEYHARH